MRTPQRTLVVELLGNKYKLQYPNTGGLIDLELLKIEYGKGNYSRLETSTSNSGLYAKFLIDAFATFTIMCPDMIKDLRVESLLDLDPVDSKKVLHLYIEKVQPWLLEWEKLLSSDFEKEEVDVEQQGEQYN